jgi:putative NADH-flavin reductase
MTKNTRDTAGGRAYLDLQNRARRERRPTQEYLTAYVIFGAHMPGERLGRYRLGDDVVVQPEDGGAISGPDYALGFVDLIEAGDHHRAHVNLGH